MHLTYYRCAEVHTHTTHAYMNFHKNRKFTSLRNQITFNFTLDIQDKLRVKGEDWHPLFRSVHNILQSSG